MSRTPKLKPYLHSVAVAAALCLQAGAQTTPVTPADVAGGSADASPLVLDKFTVSGYRASMRASLDLKRASDAIVDVVTAEDIGKFADTNVAETLSHVPGVTVDTMWGQGERVSINGTDPDLNRTLLNGQTIATGDWYELDVPSRNFNYTLLAPEVLGDAQVYKTSEARLPEGSIGGTVILHTRQPLDLPANTMAGSFGENYNDRSKEHNPLGSVIYSWKDAEKNFGLIASVQKSHEHLRRDGIEAYGFSFPGNTTDNGLDPLNPALAAADGGEVANPAMQRLMAANPNAIYPTEEGTAFFEQDRTRLGYQVGLQFKPAGPLEIDFNTLWVRAGFSNKNDEFYYNTQAPGSLLTNATVANGVVSSAHFDGGDTIEDAIYDPNSVTFTQDYDLKATWKGNGWNLAGQAGRTYATGGAQREVFTEANNTGGYAYSNGGTYFTWDDPTTPLDPSQWSFSIGPFQGNETRVVNGDAENYAQLDFDAKLPVRFLRRLLVGGKYSDHTTYQDNYTAVPDPSAYPATLAAFPAYLTPSNYLSGISGVSSQEKHHFLVDEAAVEAFYTALNLPFTKQPNDYANTWTVEEKVSAAYAELEFGSGKFSGNAGVRYVRTLQDSSGYNVDGAGNATPAIDNRRYTNALPSLNLVYDVRPDVAVRFGASKVIARQNYYALSTATTLQDPLPGGIGFGQGANPNLDPYRSANFDLSVEWYHRRNSLLQLAVFDRQIANYTTSRDFLEQHFSAALGPTYYNVGRPVNGGSATSRGFNLAYVEEFAGGFGVAANYTYTSSSGIYGPLPWASKNSVNISPYFENRTWSARVTYAWRSDYVFFSSINELPDWVKANTQVDASVSYHLNPHWWVSLDGSNLLDATYEQFLKDPAHLIVSEYKSGRRFELSAHFKY